MIVLDALERSRIDIPANILLNAEGVLSLDDRLLNKGFIEIRQVGKVLKLEVKGVVGRLLLNKDISLDVRPKFPVSNLNRMVYAAESRLINPFDTERPYTEILHDDFLPIPLVASFCKSLKIVLQNGLLRSYERQTVEGPLRPRVDFGKSQQRFWAKLQPTQTVNHQFVFTNDNLTNQVLKLATRIAVSVRDGTNLLDEFNPIISSMLLRTEKISAKHPDNLRKRLSEVRRRCPTFRPDLAIALSHACELITRTDVSLNLGGDKLELESYLISLDSIFERYLRWTLMPVGEGNHGTLSGVDGNLKRHQRKLFRDNKRFAAKPDFVFKDHRGVVMIGDAKYKNKPKEEDRYQIISHALAYGVKKAILIYPFQPTGRESGLVRLGFVGPADRHVEVYNYFFDLNADLKNEETKLKSCIHSLCP